MSHYLFQSLWPTLAFWAVLYISDYVLTVTCARLYRGGIDRNIVFEGSFELNPVFQKDIDSLRWLSPRFIWLLLLTEVWLAWTWMLSKWSQPEFYEFILGIMVLVELMIHLRHLKNLFLFRAIRAAGGLVGRIEYPRTLILRMSSFEALAFAGAYLLLFAFTGSWFIFGGVVGCLSVAIKHRLMARRYRAVTAVVESNS